MSADRESRRTNRSGFAHIDTSPVSARLVEYLTSVSAVPFIRQAKDVSYRLLGLTTGSVVLDVGCGLGDDVRELARIVGANGIAYGVDLSNRILDLARDRNSSISNSQFVQGSAASLPFGDAVFDAARAERCLLHVEEPQRCLAQLVRVVKPGGIIVLLDIDFQTLLINSSDKATTNIVMTFFSESMVNGFYVRETPELFARLGCSVIAIESVTVTFDKYGSLSAVLDLSAVIERVVSNRLLSPEDANEWLLDVSSRDPFFASMTMFVIAVKKRDLASKLKTERDMTATP